MKSAIKISKTFAQLTLAATLILLANGCDRPGQQKGKILPPVTSPTVSVSPVSPTPQPVTSPTPELVPPQPSVPSHNQSPPVNSPSEPSQISPSPLNRNGNEQIPPHPLQNPTENTPRTNSDSSLDGIWKLQYSVNGIIYESGLEMRGNDGKMLTHFFDVNTNQSEMVEQTIELKPSPQGIVLFGSNPVYPGTQTAYPSYSPDNFLFRVNPDGSRIFYTCDDAGNCSPVEIEYLGSN